MKDKKNQNEGNGTLAIKPKKKKKVLIIVLVIVAIIAILVGTAIHNMTKAVDMVSNTVEVEPVQKRDLSDTISLKGTVAGDSRTNVMSVAAAEITAVEVQVGDIVKEGDPLVTLDREDIEKQIADLEQSISNSSKLEQYSNKDLQDALTDATSGQSAELKAAQEAIDSAVEAYNTAKSAKIKAMIDAQNEAKTAEDKATLEQATREYVNGGYLKDADIISAQRAIDKANENYTSTQKNSVEAAQEAIDKSQYTNDDTLKSSRDTLDSLKKQLTDCELKAPCGGAVVAVNVSVGDKNTAGQTMITIEDTNALKMVATVEEADILKLQEGMNATVTADALGEESIKGTVTRVVRVKSQSTGNTTDNTVTAGSYSVEIALDTTELLVGMSTKARVMIKEKGEQLAIPYDVIQTDENGNSFVYVAKSNADGTATAVKKNIEVGEEVDYYTEITGGDLKEGDMLIYDYSYTIVEGQTFAPEQMYSNQSMGADGMSDTEAEVAE